MAMLFRPGIYNPANTTFLYCPRPIISCDVPLTWDFSKHKVPLVAGAKTYGLSLNEIQVTISGQFGIGTDGSTKTLTEADMWSAFSTFGTHLSTGDKDTFMELFLYYDTSGGGTYRKLKLCRPVSFAASIGDDHSKLFGYTLVMMSGDPTIYTTAAGS